MKQCVCERCTGNSTPTETVTSVDPADSGISSLPRVTKRYDGSRLHVADTSQYPKRLLWSRQIEQSSDRASLELPCDTFKPAMIHIPPATH